MPERERTNAGQMLSFTRAKVAEFKTAYAAALAAYKDGVMPGDATFTFEGHVWNITFAKYAIEFLEERFQTNEHV